MKPPCLKHVVYRALFPHPREGDPASFSEFVNRCIVPEVRTETVRFYGPIDELEAKYPGLDYAAPAHRLRLRHFPNHCKLFDAFDRLQLTRWEIYELCKWEGTKNAKDKYMKHNKMNIHDTTFDGLKHDTRPRLRPTSLRSVRHHPASPAAAPEMPMLDGNIDVHSNYESPDEDVVAQSVGVPLNERLRIATAARLQGQNVPLDPAYEQWLKEAREQGTIGQFSAIPAIGASPLSPLQGSFGPGISSVRRSYPQHHRRHSSLSANPYEASYYWTRTVPEIYQHGAQLASPSLRQPLSPFSAQIMPDITPRRLPAPPNTLAASNMMELAPARPMIASSPGPRRTRRR